LVFTYRFIKFEYIARECGFFPVKFECDGVPYDKLRSLYGCPSSDETQRQLQRLRFGRCELAVPKKKVVQVLVDEVLNPFYIF